MSDVALQGGRECKSLCRGMTRRMEGICEKAESVRAFRFFLLLRIGIWR